MTRANGAIPATRSAVRISPEIRGRRAAAPLHRAAGGRSRAITTADAGLSGPQRRIRTCVQRGGSPATTR